MYFIALLQRCQSDVNRDAICSSETARNILFPRTTSTTDLRNAPESCKVIAFALFPFEVREIIFVTLRSFGRSNCDTLFARSQRKRQVRFMRTAPDFSRAFYGASFLLQDNRRMNGKWVKSVSRKIKSFEKLSTIVRVRRRQRE